MQQQQIMCCQVSCERGVWSDLGLANIRACGRRASRYNSRCWYVGVHTMSCCSHIYRFIRCSQCVVREERQLATASMQDADRQPVVRRVSASCCTWQCCHHKLQPSLQYISCASCSCRTPASVQGITRGMGSWQATNMVP